MVMQQNKHHALDVDPILRALSSFYGVTTTDGNVGGTTLICDVLIGSNDFISDKTILLQSGPSIFEDAGATAFNPVNGQITVSPAFSAQVLAGVEFYVLNSSSATAIAALAAIVAAIKTQTDKLAGQAPGVGTTTDNWQAAEADVVSIGADNTSYKLHSLLLDINALAGTITIRLYMQINGVERRVYQTNFTVAADGPGLWIVNGTVGIHEVLRVTAQSDNAADNDQAIAYDYMLEAM